jgi:hypothetical protein
MHAWLEREAPASVQLAAAADPQVVAPGVLGCRVDRVLGRVLDDKLSRALRSDTGHLFAALACDPGSRAQRGLSHLDVSSVAIIGSILSWTLRPRSLTPARLRQELRPVIRV